MKQKINFPTEIELKNAVTIRRAFFDITQDVNAAILLSQLYYWSKRTSNREGWVYKTQKELKKEIFLTPYQQRGARKLLVSLNLMEEKCEGLPKKMYFRIKRQTTDEFHEQNKEQEVKKMRNHMQNNTYIGSEELDSNNEETSEIEINKPDHNNEEIPSNTNIEEITTKITAKITTSAISNTASFVPNLQVAPETQAQIVFNHWKMVMNHPNAKMDKNRKKLITDALTLGYSVEDLCRAISGCAVTPHNIGLNDRGQKFDGLHIILRNADQIDRFIGNFLNPPRQKNKSDRLIQDNMEIAQRWLSKSDVGSIQ